MREHKKNKRRLIGKVAALAGVFSLLAGVGNAQANNFTDAGTNVENTFTLDYEVSGTSQPTITNDPNLGGGSVLQGGPTQFTVDRLIDLVVQQQNSPLQVAPGTTGAVLEYLITNEGNDNQSYSFSIADVTGDDFDGTYTIEYFIDSGDAGTDPFDDTGVSIVATTTGTGSTVNITPDIAPDVTFGVRITTDISGTASDADVDDLVLVAQTRDPVDWIEEGSTGSEGDITAADPDSNTDDGVAENVLADGNGGTGEEADNDGMHSDVGQYIIASPDLTAAKSVDVIATTPSDCATDPAGGTGEYSVPGSCVEYVITVDNNGATATAEAIDIVDVLPAEVEFVAASFSGWEAAPVPTLTTPSGAATNCDGTPATCNVTLTGASLAATETGTLTIRALVK